MFVGADGPHVCPRGSSALCSPVNQPSSSASLRRHMPARGCRPNAHGWQAIGWPADGATLSVIAHSAHLYISWSSGSSGFQLLLTASRKPHFSLSPIIVPSGCAPDCRWHAYVLPRPGIERTRSAVHCVACRNPRTPSRCSRAILEYRSCSHTPRHSGLTCGHQRCDRVVLWRAS